MNSKINDKTKSKSNNRIEGGITDVVFILDRSGSMAGLEEDTIGGFNAILDKQKKEVGEALITTVLFDDKFELLHERINMKEIKHLTDGEYYVRRSTALLDAVGKTIKQVAHKQKHASADCRADKVMFVIITDGMENASREYGYATIKTMIEHEKEKYGWEFIFLGANIDAVSSAGDMGISSDRAANYNPDAKGTKLNYEAINAAVSQIRSGGCFKEEWKDQIDEDFQQRGKKS